MFAYEQYPVPSEESSYDFQTQIQDWNRRQMVVGPTKISARLLLENDSIDSIVLEAHICEKIYQVSSTQTLIFSYLSAMMTEGNENVREFYTVTIQSENLSIYTDPDKTTVDDMSLDKSLYYVNLQSQNGATRLPRQLNGIISVQDDVSAEEEAWSRLKLFCSTAEKPRKPYDIKICASPGCCRAVLPSKQSNHLNLCVEHSKQLYTILQKYQRNYEMNIPDKDHHDVDRMVYSSLLPSIDCLIQKLSVSSDSEHKFIIQILFAIKACIYLYRIHLNPFPGFIQTTIGLFQWLLNLNKPAMCRFAERILHLITIPFAIFGIGIIWSANLICHERHLATVLINSGVGLGIYGYMNHRIDPTAFALDITQNDLAEAKNYCKALHIENKDYKLDDDNERSPYRLVGGNNPADKHFILLYF
ncbi:hypothetical protein I4U23_004793 [Adineta vaga]|nr:hypothetical protein I4U23_004793 [Adineta vaga]